MKEEIFGVSFTLSDLCILFLNLFDNKIGISLSINSIINDILKKNSVGKELDLKLVKSIKIKIKIIAKIFNELNLCIYNKDIVIWNGLGMVSEKLNLIKLKKINKENNRSLFINIFRISIKKCLKLNNKTTFDDIVEYIKEFLDDKINLSKKNISRRLYDIINILSSIGIIIYNKKQIIIPEEVIKNYKEYYKKLDKNKIKKKKRKAPIKDRNDSKKIKITDAKLLLQFSKN
tara:strand:- start:369 stop:1064 length:696 start_codon:yes stop_codon:yes gene_type:complete